MMDDDETKEKVKELRSLEVELAETKGKHDELSSEITKKKDEIISSLAEEEED